MSLFALLTPLCCTEKQNGLTGKARHREAKRITLVHRLAVKEMFCLAKDTGTIAVHFKTVSELLRISEKLLANFLSCK